MIVYHRVILKNIHGESNSFIFNDLGKARARFDEYLKMAEKDKEKFGAAIFTDNKSYISVEVPIYYNLFLVQTLYWSVDLTTDLGFN